MVVRALSLCAGVGGLELGLKLAIPELQTLCYVEWDRFCADTLVGRIGQGMLDDAPIWDDVRTFDGTAWRGRVDLLCGGYPCTPWSIIGKRSGADHPAHLWPEFARIIRECQPRACFFENVANHLNLGFPEVHADLEAMGYRVAAGLFSAAEIGAPHTRERLFILADAGGERGLARSSFAQRQGRQLSEGRTQSIPEEQGRQACQSDGEPGPASPPLWPPYLEERERWAALPDDLQPDVWRMADGMAHGLDERQRAIGNGVCSLVAAHAWRTIEAALAGEQE